MQEKQETREYWTAIFEACRLSEQHERLEEFLKDPWTVLCRHGQESAPECMARGFRPLLPRQAAVARRLAEAEAGEADIRTSGPVRPARGCLVSWRPFPVRGRRDIR